MVRGWKALVGTDRLYQRELAVKHVRIGANLWSADFQLNARCVVLRTAASQG